MMDWILRALGGFSAAGGRAISLAASGENRRYVKQRPDIQGLHRRLVPAICPFNLVVGIPLYLLVAQATLS